MRLVLSTSIMSKRLDELAKTQDSKISTWKDSIKSRANEIQSSKSNISQLQKLLQNQETITTLPVSDNYSLTSTQPCCVSPTSSGFVQPNILTTDILTTQNNSTDTMSAPTQPTDTPNHQDNNSTPSVPIQQMDTHTTQNHVNTMSVFLPPNTSNIANVETSQSLLVELNKELINLKQLTDKEDGVNFVIDNIDIRQNVNNMTEENQDVDCHWVNANVVFNRVSGNNLSDDRPIKDVMDVDNLEVLPTMEDHLAYRKNLKVYIQRILVERIPCLRHLQDSVQMHIPHVHQMT